MIRSVRTIIKVLAGLVFILVGLLCVGTILLNTKSVQQRLLREATAMLSERLGTKVSADSVSVSLFPPSASLYGVCINDQQGGPFRCETNGCQG